MYPRNALERNMRRLILFVCLGFFVPLEHFSLIWRHLHYRWKAANFDLCSASVSVSMYRDTKSSWYGHKRYTGGYMQNILIKLSWGHSRLILLFSEGKNDVSFIWNLYKHFDHCDLLKKNTGSTQSYVTRWYRAEK